MKSFLNQYHDIMLPSCKFYVLYLSFLTKYVNCHPVQREPIFLLVIQKPSKGFLGSLNGADQPIVLCGPDPDHPEQNRFQFFINFSQFVSPFFLFFSNQICFKFLGSLNGADQPIVRVGKKWEPRNAVPGPFSVKIWKVIQNSKSRREFGK